MQKVILKFIGTGVGNNYQACVKIYDTYGNILYQEETYNGEVVLCLEKGKVYKVIASSYGDFIRNVFYVNGYDEKYIFYFNRALQRMPLLKTITFFLSDANYQDLPIEKGEIILWQK